MPVSHSSTTQFLSRAREDLVCGICLNLLQNPCVFNCQHMFCKGCGLKLIESGAHSCPICRKRITLYTNASPTLRQLTTLLHDEPEDLGPASIPKRWTSPPSPTPWDSFVEWLYSEMFIDGDHVRQRSLAIRSRILHAKINLSHTGRYIIRSLVDYRTPPLVTLRQWKACVAILALTCALAWMCVDPPPVVFSDSKCLVQQDFHHELAKRVAPPGLLDYPEHVRQFVAARACLHESRDIAYASFREWSALRREWIPSSHWMLADWACFATLQTGNDTLAKALLLEISVSGGDCLSAESRFLTESDSPVARTLFPGAALSRARHVDPLEWKALVQQAAENHSSLHAWGRFLCRRHIHVYRNAWSVWTQRAMWDQWPTPSVAVGMLLPPEFVMLVSILRFAPWQICALFVLACLRIALELTQFAVYLLAIVTFCHPRDWMRHLFEFDCTSVSIFYWVVVYCLPSTMSTLLFVYMFFTQVLDFIAFYNLLELFATFASKAM